MAALIVEDGSRVTGSNTYVSITTADTYWDLRNNSVWAAASDEEKQRALLDAARYLDFGYRWIGTRVRAEQSMTWPRYMPYLDADDRLVLSTEVPLRVRDAQCELALESLSLSLMPSLDRAGREKSIAVGPLHVEYFGDASGTKAFPVADVLLADLITSKQVNGLTARIALS